uniref:Secreted protein n=1 Tax=Oryza barthii TaxID=65489 RepID=A0A0D3EYV0_9ORYZ
MAAAAVASWLASRCACTYADETTAENGAGVLSSAAATTLQLQPCSTCSAKLRRRRQVRHGY